MNTKIMLSILAAAVLGIGIAVVMGVNDAHPAALATLVVAGFVPGIAIGLLVGAKHYKRVTEEKERIKNNLDKLDG